MEKIIMTVHQTPVHPSERRMREILDTEVKWCCPGRHGALMNIDPDNLDEYLQTLSYFYAAEPDEGIWIRKHKDSDIVDLEFTHMAKVFPPPEFPWGWCGKSILFPERRL